jgi:uncharacterized membrane protein
MFSKNEGPVDRALRVVAGIVLIPVGLFVLAGIEASVVGIVVAAFGGWLVVTGATGVCPGYVPFGFTSLPKKEPVPSIDRSTQAA